MSQPEESVQVDSKSQKLIDVARQLFQAQGFTATSMDDVAKQAHMSKTTLYKRYPSKSALFAAVISNMTEHSGLDVSLAALTDLPIQDALFEIGMRFLDLICQPDALRMELVYHSEGALIPEVAAAFERGGPRQVIDIVKRFFRYAVRKQMLVLADPQFVAMQFLIAIKGDPHGLTFRQSDIGTRAEKAARVRRVVQLFMDGLRPR